MKTERKRMLIQGSKRKDGGVCMNLSSDGGGKARAGNQDTDRDSRTRCRHCSLLNFLNH